MLSSSTTSENKWINNNKDFETCNVKILTNTTGMVIVEGIIKDPLRSKLLSNNKQNHLK